MHSRNTKSNVSATQSEDEHFIRSVMILEDEHFIRSVMILMQFF